MFKAKGLDVVSMVAVAVVMVAVVMSISVMIALMVDVVP